MTKRGNGAIGPHVVFAILLCALVVAQGEALAATPQPVRMKSDLSRERTFVPSGGSVVLYDQVDQPSRTSVGSSNGPGADPEDASGADDFAVPLVETWLVKAVDVVGVDFSEKPSERVRFYLDHGGHPGTVIATIRNVAGINSGGVLSIPLGSHAPTLEAGHYWVAVQSNQPQHLFFWRLRTVETARPAAWENPLDGFGTGCTTWRKLNSCFGFDYGDFMFALEGTQHGS